MIANIEREVQRMVRPLEMPYPEKSLFAFELTQDIHAYVQELLDNGIPRKLAFKKALTRFQLRNEDAADLVNVHRSAIQRFVDQLAQKGLSTALVDAAHLLPLLGFAVFLFTSAPFIEFFQAGGGPLWPVLGVGGVALILQIYRFFGWFILRDHSESSLEKNDRSAPVASAIVFMLGVFATSLDYYVVLTKWAHGEIRLDQLWDGLYEPLPCIIVASALSACLLLLHLLIQLKLKWAGVPKKYLCGFA
ncbi:MAG: hypothetical protein AB7T49_13115 [Oligoflexales bacterium]